MKMIHHYVGGLKGWTNYSGTATRPQFWYFILAIILIMIGLNILGIPLFLFRLFSSIDEFTFAFFDGVIFVSIDEFITLLADILFYVYIIFFFVMLAPTLALIVRRLHDSDKSALWLFFALIPLIGPAGLIWVLTNETRENKYGVKDLEA